MSPATAAAASEAPLPDFETLGRRHAGRLPPRDLRALQRWLVVLPADGGTLEQAVANLEAGARWLRGREGSDQGEPSLVVRLRLLVEVLEEVAPWRRALSATVARVLADGDALPALESGLPNDRGLWPESADRLARRFLPTADSDRDLGALVSRLFPRGEDAAALASVPAELASRLCRIADGGGPAAPEPFARVRRALLDAIALIATRTSALGLSGEIRERCPPCELAASPFFLLPRLCDALFDGGGSVAACREQIDGCRRAIDTVRMHLEEFGVSVDVVYRLEVIAQNLDRLGELLTLQEARGADERAVAGLAFVGRIAAARVRHNSLRDTLATNLHLLARKVIEHAGKTGEHYITVTRRQWWRMLASGAGGGFVTGATVLIKYLVMWGQFAPFIEGAFASANYAISFLIMQLFGFTLATKQPSMIAAALAGSLHGSGGKRDDAELDDLVTLIQRICRSQLGAAIGNVATVTVTALAIHFLYLHAKGTPFLDATAAEYTIHSFHPFQSGTIFFAAFTGVLLWLSSLGAGWLENWATYRRLPEAIAQHRLGRVLGRGTMRWLGRALRNNAAAFGGNVTIGLLLGMTPVIGRFFGIPLEVRHVTLSAGSLTLAGCSIGVGAPGFLAAIAGIVVMLMLNFGVSFGCALFVALRARGIDHAGRRLLRAIARRFVREPVPFFVPAGQDAVRGEPAPHL